MSIARTAIALTLLLGLTGPAFAQGGPGGYGPGPAQGLRGEERGPGGGHRMMARAALEGPSAPAVLRDSVGLSGEELQRYAQRYANYTAQTGPVRDSLRTSMKAMRAAFESGNRAEARSRHDTVERQAQELSKKDQDFEKVLKQSLTKDQQKRYDQWKDARDKAARERHHHMRRQPAGNS